MLMMNDKTVAVTVSVQWCWYRCCVVLCHPCYCKIFHRHRRFWAWSH